MVKQRKNSSGIRFISLILILCLLISYIVPNASAPVLGESVQDASSVDVQPQDVTTDTSTDVGTDNSNVSSDNKEKTESDTLVNTQEESKKDFVYEDNDMTVTAKFSDDSGLPSNTKLSVEPITEKKDKKDYNALREAVNDQIVDKNQGLTDVLFYDIAFTVDGKETEPASKAKITIKYKGDTAFDKEKMGRADDVAVVHMTENNEGIKVDDVSDTVKNVKNLKKGVSSLEFAADEFSPFGVVLLNDISAQAGPFTVQYHQTPPASASINISDTFNFVGYTGYDTRYPNVAVINNDITSKYGAMWSKEMLDLNFPFETEMKMYMAHDPRWGGSRLDDLADGMTFTMHNDSRGMNALGSDGEGLAVYGSTRFASKNPISVIQRSLSIEFDLYRNTAYNNTDHFVTDPNYGSDSYGDCSVVSAKYPLSYSTQTVADHKNSFGFAKRNSWIDFNMKWQPNGAGGGTLTYTFAGTSRSYYISSVNSQFGSSKVYWGFTGSTGDKRSVLAAAITKWPTQPVKDVLNDSGVSINNQYVDRGSEMTYKISYENYKDVAANITITDVLPAGVDYVTPSNGGTYNAATRTITWNLSNIPKGYKGSVAVRVRVRNDAPSTIENQATVKIDSYSMVSNKVVNRVRDIVPVAPTKTVTNSAGTNINGQYVTVGQMLTYTIAYKNYSASMATVNVTDVLPAGLTYIQAVNGSYSAATRTASWAMNVPAGGTGYVTLYAQVNSDALVSIANKASARVGSYAALDSNTVINYLQPESPTKTVRNSSGTNINGQQVAVGDILTYTINYRNYSNATANVVITDVLPSGVDYVSSSPTASVSGKTVTWNLYSIPKGQSGSVTVYARVNDSAIVTILNNASVKVGSNNPLISNTVTNTVAPKAPVKNVLDSNGYTINGQTVTLGQEIRYMVKAFNSTGSTGTMTIVDKLPAGVDYVSSSPNASYNSATHTLTWTISGVESGGSRSVVATVRVNSNAVDKIENTATSQIGSNGPQTSNKVENPVEIIKPEKSVKETNGGAVSPDGVKIGDKLTYTISYKNYSASAATVTIKDVLPVGVTYQSASNGGSYQSSNRTVTWTLSGVASGASGVVTVDVVVNQNALVVIENEATVQVGSNNPLVSNKVETDVQPEKPVKYVEDENGIVIDDDMVSVGQKLTYNILYRNYDNKTANITISDALPNGVDFVSATNGGSYNSSSHTVNWSIPNVAPGAYDTVSVDVVVNSKAIVKIENYATVKVGSNNPVISNTVENPIEPAKPVKTVSDQTGADVDGKFVNTGDLLIYNINYKNYTGSTATVTISDQLPVGTTYYFASSSGSYNSATRTVTWTVPNIASGSGGQVSLIVKVDDDALYKIENKGVVRVGLNPAQDTNTVVNYVNQDKPEKTVTDAAGKDIGGEKVKLGDELTYTISYKNYDSSTSNITISDQLPKGVDFVSATGGWTYTHATHTINWTVYNVPSGTSGTVTVKVKVNKDALVKIENEAAVKVGSHNPEISNKVENPIDPEKPVKTVKNTSGTAIGPNGVKVGDKLTYTINYRNYNNAAANIVITDELPEGVDFANASNGGTHNAGTHTVTWTMNNVAAGAEGTVTVDVIVNSKALVEIENDASVKVGNDNPLVTDKVITKVDPDKPEKTVKNASGTAIDGEKVKIGDKLTYTINYKNIDNNAASITITDQLPKGVTFNSATGGGSYNSGTHTVTWNLTNVAAGANGTVTIEVTVNKDALVKIENEAVVKVGNHNPLTSNKVENPIDPDKPVKTVKNTSGTAISPDGVKIGDKITYTVTYKNYNNAAANIVITDVLPEGVDFVSASNGGTHNTGTHTVTWTLNNVAAGAEGTVTVDVIVNAKALVEIENDASVKVGNDNPLVSDKVITKVDPDKPEKTVKNASGTAIDGEKVKVGDELTYTINYKNFDNKTATVTISDQLPKGVTFNSATGGGNYNSGTHTVNWTINNVAAGAGGTVTINVTVNKDALVKIENEAVVKVGDNNPITSNKVENPIDPDKPVKTVKNTSGTAIGPNGVKIGDKLTYTVTYKNYNNAAANIVITDELPEGVDFVSASNGGTHNTGTHTVTWTLNNVAAGAEGTVTVDVIVNSKALVELENDASVKVGNDNPLVTDKVITKIDPDKPEKTVKNASGTAIDGDKVKVGDKLTYSITYKNFDNKTATVTISDKLPKGVTFNSATGGGNYNSGTHTVNWTINNVAAGAGGTVTIDVTVNKDALVKIENEAVVKVGDNNPMTSNKVENPIEPDKPVKTVKNTSGTAIGPNGVKIGDKLTYTVTYKNYNNAAANIVITDELPEGVDFVKASNGGTHNAGTHTVTWTLNNVAAGEEGSVTVDVIVNANALVELENDATVKVGDDNPLVTDKVITKVDPDKPEKTVKNVTGTAIDGDKVKIGDELTYTIKYKNYTADTQIITITDQLPEGVDFVSATNGGSHNAASHTVSWTFNNIASGAEGSVSIKVVVNDKALVKIENEAVVKVGNDNPMTSNKVVNPIDPDKPVKTVKNTSGTAIGPNGVKIGDKLTYTVEYKNHHDSPANIVITDELPEGVDFVKASNGGTHNAGTHTVTWTINNVAAGAKGTVTVDVIVNADALVELENDAAVKVGDDNPIVSDKVITKVDPDKPAKTVKNATGTAIDGEKVKIGDELTYSITYKNYTADTQTIVITDQLPKGVDFVSASNNGGYNNASHTVSWTFNNIASGASGTVTIKVVVNDKALVKIENEAVVKVGNDNPMTSNKVENPIEPDKPVKTVKNTSGTAISPDGVKIGDKITYTVTYKNYNTAAANIVITDELPEGVDFVRASNGGTHNAGTHTVTWTLNNVAAGAEGSVTVDVIVNADALVELENDATVKVGDDNPLVTDKVITKVDPDKPEKTVKDSAGTDIEGNNVKVGDELTYTIKYKNYTADTQRIVITDELPEGVDFVSATNGGSHNAASNTVSWTFNSIASGAEGTVSVKVVVNSKALVQIENEAVVKVGNDNPATSNKVVNPVDPDKPVKTVKNTSGTAISPDGVKIGDRITYTITYKNYNDSPANITITDDLPEGVDFDNISDGGGYNPSRHSVSWNLRNVAAGHEGFVTVDVIVNEYALVELVNDATVRVGRDNPQVTDEVITKVQPEKPVKTVKDASGADIDGQKVKIGDELTYTIAYKNNNDSTATLVITDQLPDGVDFVSATGRGASYNGITHTVTWTMNSMAAGATGTVTIKVKVNQSALVKIENEASIQIGLDNPVITNKVVNPIEPDKPVKTVKNTSGTAISPDGVKIGDKLTYTVEYKNYHGSPANIVITDVLPDGVDYVTSSNNGNYVSGTHTVTWTLNNVAAGASGTVTVDVIVNAGALVELENDATVKVGDDNPLVTDKVITIVDPDKPEKTVKDASGADIDGKNVKVGDELTYTIKYKNYTASTQTITVTDQLPEGVDFVSASNGGTHNAASHTVSWTFNSIAAGAEGTVNIKVVVNNKALVQIENEAVVKVGNDNPATSNKVVNPVDPDKPVKTVKNTSGTAISPDGVKIGDRITYTITYKNYNNSAANITITDELPEGVDFDDISNGGGYNPSRHTVSWNLRNVPAGEEGFVTVDVIVNEYALVQLENDATVRVGRDNPQVTDEVITKVQPEKPVKVVKDAAGNSIDGQKVKIGDELTYSITYKNFDDKTATITITDQLPDGVTFVSATNGGTYDAATRTVTWTAKSIAAGGSGTVSTKVTVNKDALVQIENEAVVKVGDNNPMTSNKVVNPVEPGKPVKTVKNTSGTAIGPNGVKIGDKLTYTITYKNYHSSAAYIMISDELPEGVDFVSADNGGYHNAGAHTVTWLLSNVASGAEGTVSVNVIVNDKALVEIENDASVKVGDDNPLVTDKVITKVDPDKPVKTVENATGTSIDGDAVKVGDQLTYKIQYKNYDNDVRNIIITDQLPDGVTFNSATDGGSHNPANNTVTWIMNNIASGASGEVTVKVTVNGDALVKIENEAVVKVGTNNPMTSNKVVNPIEPENPRKAVTSGSGINGADVRPGNDMEYTIYYKNYDNKASTVVITDTLDQGLDYVGSSSNGSYVTGTRTVTWTIDNVPAGYEGFVTLKVKVNNRGIGYIQNEGYVKVGDHNPLVTNKTRNILKQY